MQSFTLGVVGLLAGEIDAAGYRWILVTFGSFMIVGGTVAMSFASTWIHFLFAQSICIGIGAGCLYVPSVVLPAEAVHSKSTVAMGIAQSGGAVGGIIWPIIFQQLLPSCGFGWTIRISAIIACVTCGTASIAVFAEASRRKPEPLSCILRGMHSNAFDLRALKTASFAGFVLASFTSDLGLFGPTTYIDGYGLEIAHLSPSDAAALLPVMNAASVFGRLLPGALASWAGSFELLVPTAILTGALTFMWISVGDNVVGLFAFAAGYGVLYGAYIMLPEVAVIDFTKDQDRRGPRIGLCGFSNALGSLIGVPIAGRLLAVGKGYLGIQLFAGSAMVLTGVLMFAVHWRLGTAKI